jgi:DNA repair exonuclease SbcCD ATPase subunit
LFRQADLDGISEEKDGNKRKNVLKEPLNLARYSRLEKVVKDKISPIRKDITHHQGQIDNIGSPKEDIEAAQVELDKCLEQHVATAIKAGEVVQTIERKREELDVLKSKLSRGDSEIHVKVAEQERKIKDLNKRVRDINEGLRVDHQRIQELDKKRIEIDCKIADINTKLTELRSKDVEDLEEIKEKLKKVREDELKGTNLITKTEVQIEQRQLSLPKDDKCSTCYQPITKDYRSEFEANINSQIKELQEERDHYVESLRKCRGLKKRLEDKVQAIEEHYNEITLGSNAVKTEKTRREDALEHAERLMEQIKRQEKQQEDLSTQLQEASERYDKLKELAKQSDAAELNAQISALQHEIKDQEETIESFNQQLCSLKQKEGSLLERLKTRSADKDKLKELKQQMVKLRRDLSDWKMVAEAFSPKGIPTYIIHTVLDELQQETNKALRTLRPELEVQFDSELNITYRRFGQVRDYNILSYGQKVYIALAFKRGLSKVIQRRLGVDIRILIFDECDQPMDRAGQEALVDAIRRWSQDFTVLMITHNDRLKDKFTHAILVEEGDDGSCASVVTQW